MNEVETPKYQDMDGKEVSLETLCEKEPCWAASRIRAMTSNLLAMTAERDKAKGLLRLVQADPRGQMMPFANVIDKHLRDHP